LKNLILRTYATQAWTVGTVPGVVANPARKKS